MQTLFFFILFLTSICFGAASFADSIDRDGDGKGDPTGITITNDSSLRWDSLLSGNSFSDSETESQFGENGDHIAVGNWTNSGESEFGVVSAADDGDVLWTVRTTASGDQQISFGTEIDTLISGADFDGNGAGDAAFVRNIDKASKLVLTVKFNPFAGGGTEVTRKFARSSFHFFYADIGGDGRDEFCFFTPRKKDGKYSGLFRLMCVEVVNGTTVRSAPFGKVVGRPLPISRGSGRSDLLLFSTNKGKKLLLRDVTGDALLEVSTEAGTLLVGDFAGGSADEFGVATDGTLTVYSSENGLTFTLNSPGDIAIDLININDFVNKNRERFTTRSAKGKPVGSVGKVKKGAGGGSGGSIGCDVNRNPFDGSEGFLWKPESDSSGLLAVLLPAGSTPSSVSVEKGGTVFEQLTLTGFTNPNRPTYRSSSKEGGEFPDGSDLVGTYAGVRHCWNIADTAQRVD